MSFRATTLKALLAALMLAQAAPGLCSTPKNVLVRVNPAPESDATLRHSGQGLIVDLMIKAEETHALRAHPGHYEYIRRQMPGVDLGALIRQKTACLPLDPAAASCPAVTVLQPHDDSGAAAVLDADRLQGFLTLNIDSTRWGVDFLFTYLERVPSAQGPASKRIMVRHQVLNCRGLKGSVVAGAGRQRLGKKQLQLNDCWFRGSPSRLEASLDAALDEFIDITRRLYPLLGAEDQDIDDTLWWKQLPSLSDLKSSGQHPCSGQMCKWKYLSFDGNRLASMPTMVPQRALVVSAPTQAD